MASIYTIYQHDGYGELTFPVAQHESLENVLTFLGTEFNYPYTPKRKADTYKKFPKLRGIKNVVHATLTYVVCRDNETELNRVNL